MSRNRMFVIGLISLALLFSAGCHHNVKTNNPAVIAAITLDDASNTCKTLEDTVTAANHAVELVETTDPEYYAKSKALIQKISAANRLAGDKINISMHGQPADWHVAFSSIATSVDPKDLTSVQVKNPNTQLLIVASMQALTKILTSIH
jgi:hypothetical protein